MNKKLKNNIKWKKELNENYLKVLHFLIKNKIDFVLSKKRRYNQTSRSIYITVGLVNKQPFEIRISNHVHSHEHEVKEEYSIILDYENKVNFRKLKKKLIKISILIKKEIKNLKYENKIYLKNYFLNESNFNDYIDKSIDIIGNEKFSKLTNNSKYKFLSKENQINQINIWIKKELGETTTFIFKGIKPYNK